MSRSYYSNSIEQFLSDDHEKILGILAAKHQFALEDLQKNSWISQIKILKTNLSPFRSGWIFLEFSIPRMGKRADVIIVVEGIIFVIEFKVGEAHYTRDAIDQVLDYALDLKNFHEESHHRPIVPMVIATKAQEVSFKIEAYSDKVYKPILANSDNLGQVVRQLAEKITATDIDPLLWENSLYKPTPTIIEAAQALYRGHSVEEISRHDAGAENLSQTCDIISQIIEKSKSEKLKSICFITGVPGAGKTLAGLNIANERLKIDENEHTVFLSGNGPLVNVLQEALARNERETSAQSGVTKKSALQKARTFIQNIHHFRDDSLSVMAAPTEKVVIFDEAQRAWDLRQTASFMARKKGVLEFSMSEPEFLISVMDRHSDWAVIICLIGGGQEINTGEAGMLEWFRALKHKFPDWKVHTSNRLSDYEYTRGIAVQNLLNPDQLTIEDNLHLSVSVRSFRSEKMSELVKLILDCEIDQAKKIYQQIKLQYPIVLTRNIEKAKGWLKEKARGTERYGLLASSGAYRLKPYGINIQANVDTINWFLNNRSDVRSSYYLEDVATEFDIQGLELDWICVAWDADFRYKISGWDYRAFRGTVWQKVNDETRILFLKNAYRVLLTRARQGMVIFIPEGTNEDKTRLPEFYDGTYNYLQEIGLDCI